MKENNGNDYVAAIVFSLTPLTAFVLGATLFKVGFVNSRSDCEKPLAREYQCVAVYVTPDQLKQIKGE